jgi:hypothetical protein
MGVSAKHYFRGFFGKKPLEWRVVWQRRIPYAGLCEFWQLAQRRGAKIRSS